MKNKAKKQKKPKKIGRPSRLLYWLFYHFVYPRYRRRYGLSLEGARALREIKGPAIVLASHTSQKDHWLLGMALYPVRPNFVVSEHFTKKPLLRPLLSLAHVITKKMFCADVRAVINMTRAVREGNTIVLFPEGRLTAYGRTARLADGTAALIRKLGVDVYTFHANGAALTFPKWSKEPHRGEIRVTAERLFTAEEAKALPLEEIEVRMAEAVAHNDYEAMRGVTYRSVAPAAGLDGILYRCPACEREFTMTAEGNTLTCPCGMRATLGEDYRLQGVPFDTPLDWYDWQCAALDTGTPLTCEARVGTYGRDGKMDKHAGHARITLDREKFTFEGEAFGEALSFTRTTDSLPAFPITVGEEFDVYHRNVLYYLFPEPDNRAAMKWVAYLDRVTEQRIGAKTARRP